MLSRILVSIFFICTSTILNGQVGELDSSFGDNGIVITNIDGSDHIYDMLIQPDKKIVVLGYSYGIPNIGGIELVTVVRYLPDGNLDSNFGEEGISVINYPHNNFDACYAIAIQSDGDLVIAGKTNFQVEKNDVDDWVLFRLNGNGTLDSTFGYKGLVQTDFGNEFEHANDVLIQEDGKIIALGMTYEYSAGLGTCFAMVRYNINGTVDTTFGSQGFVKTFIQESAVALGGIIAPEGKIMAYGTTRNEFNVDYAIVRYKEDGELDSLFGLNGIVYSDIQGLKLMDKPTSILLEPDGKITLGGLANFIYTPVSSDVGVVRYNSDGSLDKNFGESGLSLIQLGSNTQIYSMSLRPDGKYILAGNTNVMDSAGQWLLLRLDHNGVIDPLFGNNGIVLTDIDGTGETIVSTGIQSGNRLIAAGTNKGISEFQDFVLARYYLDSLSNIEDQNISALYLSIAPNPSNDIIKLTFDEKFGHLNYTILDVSGNIRKQESGMQVQGNEILIDTKMLETGLYFLEISNGFKSRVGSFIKNN